MVKIVVPIDLTCPQCGGTTADLEIVLEPEELSPGARPMVQPTISCHTAGCPQGVRYGEVPAVVSEHG